jgi:hypothetical protein
VCPTGFTGYSCETMSGRIEASSNGLSSSTTALIVGTSSMRTTQ